MTTTMSRRHRVVVIGSGFGGLFAAKRLRRANVDVTLISRTTHHLFQPLLYQVATGILSEGEIAPSTREILKRQENVQTLLGDVSAIDVNARTVTSEAGGVRTVTAYDSLIVAAGATTSYFGNDDFATYAPGLKSIDDALELRGRILSAFEFAELEQDERIRDEWQTFVVVGAGATGVEMAGQISELSHRTLRNDFRAIDPRRSRIVLVDALDDVLGSFGSKLSNSAAHQLEKLGVDVWLSEKVVEVDERGITVEDKSGLRTRIQSRTVVWAAGVKGSDLANSLAAQTGAELDRGNRIKVQGDCTLPGHPEVYVIGDMMSLKGYPGVAQVAMQQGKYAADQIKRHIGGKARAEDFHYFDKGSMATISRFKAVASIGDRLRFGGVIAWFLWLVIHVLYLVGFKNRVTTVLHWAVSFLGRGRSQRTTTNQQLVGRNAVRAAQLPDNADPALAERDERTERDQAADRPQPAAKG
ncbi:NADH dehydrogenase [Jatrophihabitans endophyticus]|uniref:NADH:ubiquinone reductase (non-electrogenic) n=1 Tax=Jatrophihabitans endophyticus TaxID=1206085 RepID=A0A1M5RPA9_9ACTN|nr:NAD(P)/FAD-dependent oxidoreductase [Jatrophihabitans endophyticus]SHH27938.1 NADH dehydrogenase [Jatrophihabitans endophyticus]